MEELKEQILGFKDWNAYEKRDALYKMPSLTYQELSWWSGLPDAILQLILEKLIKGDGRRWVYNFGIDQTGRKGKNVPHLCSVKFWPSHNDIKLYLEWYNPVTGTV